MSNYQSPPDEPNPFRRGDESFRFDDEPESVKRYKRNWLDRQFTDTSIVLLIFFSLCCGIFAFAFGLAGTIGCSDPKARQNAIIVLAISSVMVGIGVLTQFAEILAKKGP